MGAFSGKFISDPGRYTFQQVINKIGDVLEKMETNKSNHDNELEITITIKNSEISESITIPKESIREVIEILKLNS